MAGENATLLASSQVSWQPGKLPFAATLPACDAPIQLQLKLPMRKALHALDMPKAPLYQRKVSASIHTSSVRCDDAIGADHDTAPKRIAGKRLWQNHAHTRTLGSSGNNSDAATRPCNTTYLSFLEFPTCCKKVLDCSSAQCQASSLISQQPSNVIP